MKFELRDHTHQDAARMKVGGVYAGDLNGPTDSDWIRTELTAGASYLLTLAARDPDGAGPRSGASDTVLEIFNSALKSVASQDDQPLVNGSIPEGGLHPRISFTPQESGVFYLKVSSYNRTAEQDYSGGYRLELAETRPAPEPEPDPVVIEPAPETDPVPGLNADPPALIGTPGDDRLLAGESNTQVIIGGGRE